MRSPYAAPDTPISSAKRPRPNNSATKPDYSKPDAMETDAEKENDGIGSPVAKLSMAPPMPRGDPSGAMADGASADEEGGASKWRGHLGALFSPVLRFLGGDGSETSPEGVEGQGCSGSPGTGNTSLVSSSSSIAMSSAIHPADPADDDASASYLSSTAAAPASTSTPSHVTSTVEAEGAAEADAAEDDDDDLYDEFNPYLFIKQLPPYSEVVTRAVKPELPARRITRNTPMTLVLDLDETLVHCSVDACENADLIFPVEFNGVEYQVHVHKRPHLEAFLRAVAQHFEVVVFTASQQVYADKLLDIIDPGRELIKHRLFRDSCLLVEGNYLKDLNVLGRDMKRMVLVDNSPHAFGYQVDNGIPIESWFDDPKDKELLHLLSFLEEIQHVEDVRPIVRDRFRLCDLIAQAH